MSRAWMRGSAAIVVLGLAGYAAWRSIPAPRKIFEPGQVAAIRLMSAAQFWLQPDQRTGEIQAEPSGWRADPGSEIRFNLTSLDGMLRGKFRALTPAGATVEFRAHLPEGKTDAFLQRVIPAGHGAESAVFYFMIDPRKLPAGTLAVGLGVPEESASGVDWREIDQFPAERIPFVSAVGLPLLAYAGFTVPGLAEGQLLIHAPACFIVQTPAGRGAFATSFGFNPALFKQGSATDGIEFRCTPSSPAASGLVFSRRLDPARPEDRLLQSVQLDYSGDQASRLLVEIGPGPDNSNSWDWAVWTGFKPVAVAGP